MTEVKQNETYWQRVRRWFFPLFLAWKEVPVWWQLHSHVWHSAGKSLPELGVLIILPLISLFSPLIALLEMRQARKRRRNASSPFK